MDTTAELAVRREFDLAASPDDVWDLITDSEGARRWMGIDVEIDPVAGGAYRCEVIPGHIASGTVVEADRPRRFVFTWGWEPEADGTQAVVTPGSSTVTFELEQAGEGTRLRFSHELPSDEAAKRHGEGWDHYLPRLAMLGNGSDPGHDSWLD